MTQTSVQGGTAGPERPRPRRESDADGAQRPPRRLHALAHAGRTLIPGLVVVALAAAVSMVLGEYIPAVSPLLIAIVLGAVLANAVALPDRLAPGITFSAKKLLRVGVAVLGLQLVVGDILELGWGVIALIAAVVVLGTCGGMWLGRLLGLPWAQRLLISCGASFCGASAIAAVDGVVDADEEDTVTAIALATVFGSVMIAVVPLASAGLGLDGDQAGTWAGASIHEVGQVVAVGGVVGGGALAVAMLVKLGRVLMLAPVLVAIGAVRRRRDAASDTARAAIAVESAARRPEAAGENASRPAAKRPPIVPLFVAVFVVLVAIRSTGILPDAVVSAGEAVQTALLTAAMFALGTGVRYAALKRVGPRPLILAALLTVWVGLIGLAGAVLVG